MSEKIIECIDTIEKKCEELAKLTDPKNKLEREYSLLAQRILNNFENLRKKQEERENKIKEKEEQKKLKFLQDINKQKENSLKIQKKQEEEIMRMQLLNQKKYRIRRI